MTLDFRLHALEPTHIRNIDSLIKEFGEERKPSIVSRYLHQLYQSEEDPNLNGNLSEIIYKRTRETLRVEYPKNS